MRPHKVITTPDPILRRYSRPVHRFGRALDALIQEMFRVMNCYNGVGLAAVQIGIPSEVIVVRHPQWTGAMIDPYPIKWAGSSFEDEGCLSIPHHPVARVPRAQLVVVGYHDEKGQKRDLVAIGGLARILQHEMDHLNGALITDYEQPKALTKIA